MIKFKKKKEPSRGEIAFNLRKEGLIFKEIGIAVGRNDDLKIPVGVERVRQMVKNYKRKVELQKRFGGLALSARAQNNIFNYAYGTGEENIKSMKAGIISGDIDMLELLKIPNCGKVSAREIMDWAKGEKSG